MNFACRLLLNLSTKDPTTILLNHNHQNLIDIQGLLVTQQQQYAISGGYVCMDAWEQN